MRFPLVPVLLAAAWMLANAAAFQLGWALGGDDAGTSGLERPLRNAFYGAAIGGAQAVILASVPALRRRALLLWPLATAAGFALGVSLIKLLEGEVPRLPFVEHGLLYGIVIAPLVVGAQWLVAGRIITAQGPRTATLWLAGHLSGWMLVEVASGAIGYYGIRIALIGALLSTVTLPALLLATGAPLPAWLAPGARMRSRRAA